MGNARRNARFFLGGTSHTASVGLRVAMQYEPYICLLVCRSNAGRMSNSRYKQSDGRTPE